MVSRVTISRLLLVGLILPIAMTVTFGLAELLAAMSAAPSDPWVTTLFRVCLIGGIVWVVDLICLLIAVAIRMLGSDAEPSDKTGD